MRTGRGASIYRGSGRRITSRQIVIGMLSVAALTPSVFALPPGPRYDEVRDETTIWGPEIHLEIVGSGWASDDVGAQLVLSCPGKVDRCAAKSASFVLWREAPDWAWTRVSEVAILYGDGKRDSFETRFDGKVFRGGRIYESGIFNVPSERISKLVGAKLAVGPTTIKVSEKSNDDLLAFALSAGSSTVARSKSPEPAKATPKQKRKAL